ncbi:hypothetical protein [Pseudoduganella sp. OTU4001]|uniref:hypothetical protein n=1 Tax=Pseudoduganella sp. OTU4001 TaxID=3043854 RepID=UPI00313EA540
MVVSFILAAMDDQAFVSSLENCTLPAEQFNHAGHVRLACLYLAQHPLDEAIARTCATIRAYATHLGAADKFHATVTIALLRLLHAQGPAALADARAVLALHYSPALLASPPARAGFVAPDLAPLP